MIATITILTFVDIFLTVSLWFVYKKFEEITVELGKIQHTIIKHHGGKQ